MSVTQTRLVCPNCGKSGAPPRPLKPGTKVHCKGCKTSFVSNHPAEMPAGPRQIRAMAPIVTSGNLLNRTRNQKETEALTSSPRQPSPNPSQSALVTSGESTTVTAVGLLSLIAGLSTMAISAVAIALCWTEFAGWSIPLALVALAVGSVALLMDWFRAVAQFSTSVPGIAMGTVALCIAFVYQGGLDFKRYEPIILTKVVTKEVIREVSREPKPILNEEKLTPIEVVGEAVPTHVQEMPELTLDKPRIFASHETADETVVFVGKGNDVFYDTSTTPYAMGLAYQASSSTHFREKFGHWFRQGDERPEYVRLLSKGTLLSTLKLDNFPGTDPRLVHFVEVLNGPQKGVRGWIVDNEIISAR
jgi:hypothetical protein